MTTKVLLALAAFAAALPEVLPHILAPEHVPHALAIASAIGALVTGLMRSPLTPKLPDLDPLADEPVTRKTGRIPPLGVLLMMLGMTTPLVVGLPVAIAGCGSVRPDVADAHSVASTVEDCIESAAYSDDLGLALLACGVDTLRTVSVWCASGVLKPGGFCDGVGKLVQ